MIASRRSRPSRTGRAALAIATTASGLGLVVAAVPTAYAADATSPYACTGDATTSMEFGFETDAPAPPATVRLFSTTQFLTVRMESAVPGEIARAAADDGAVSVDVSVATAFSDALPAAAVLPWRTTMSTSQPVALGDQATPTAVPVSGAGSHVLRQPGVNDLRAGDLGVTMTFRDSSGAEVGTPLALVCTTPTAPVSDTFWVSSVTFLDLLVGTDDWSQAGASRSYEVGQPIEVHAQVGARGTQVPAGWVDFTTSAGVTQRVVVDAQGKASGVLPGFADPAGPHTVAATFVPADPVFYGAGTFPHPPGLDNYPNPVQVGVDPARTTSRVRATGLRKHRRVTVRARVDAAYDSTPAGKVRVTVRRLGAEGRWGRTRTVDDRSRAVARFGRLRPGRYQVVVRYRGDDRHLGSTVEQRFRVRR